MPRLSIWFIRSALTYLVLGFTLGALLLFNKGFPFYPFLWGLLPSHVEFVLFGWTVQLVMGMAFWILPRFSKSPFRGNEKLAWGTFILINVGIWLHVLGTIGSGSQWLVLTGRVAKALGIVVFAVYLWPRIKGVGAP